MTAEPGGRTARQQARAAAAVVAALALAFTYGPVASRKDPAPTVAAFAGTSPVLLLRDADTGHALYQRGADRPFVPASLVKLMTAFTVLERVSAGQLALDQSVTVPAALLDAGFAAMTGPQTRSGQQQTP